MPQYFSLEAEKVRVVPVYRKPFNVEESKAIAAGATDTITVSVPSGKRLFIKQVTITLGANGSADSTNGVKVDGNATKQAATFDAESVFGDMLTADTSVTLDVTNNDLGTQTSKIKVVGFTVDRETGLDE